MKLQIVINIEIIKKLEIRENQTTNVRKLKTGKSIKRQNFQNISKSFRNT